MILRIIIAVLVLLATCIGLFANGVTFTQEELSLLEDRLYDGPRFEADERIDKLMRYTYTHCVQRIGDGNIMIKGRNYSCRNQSKTRTDENGAWGRWVVSPTSDYGICQLNYKRHKDFINDKERFEDPYNQIHYCQEVREDAMRKGKMPRVAYKNT